MFITSLVLSGLKRLQLSRIKELHIDMSHSTSQLILGTNGSGKSSVLRELFPTVPNKSGFERDGFKELTLIHDNINYRLTYSPTEGHQFFRDNEQLNRSMTNEIQKELIAKYFNVSQDIQNILTCSLNICDMVPSQRKKVIMGLNPVDISLFLSNHQKVRKTVTAMGNNLDMLYQRKKQLVEQRLPEQQYNDMVSRRDELERFEKILLVISTKLSDELSRYPTIVCLSNDQLLERIHHLVISSIEYQHINRDGASSKQVEIKTKYEMIQSELLSIESSIEKTIGYLNDYENKRKLVSSNNCNIDEELSKYKLQLSRLTIDKSITPARPEDISHMRQAVVSIIDELTKITYIEYKNILDKDLSNLSQSVVLYQSDLRMASDELQTTNRQIDEIKASVRTYRIGDGCDTSSCELLKSYNEHISSKSKLLDDLDIRQTEIKTKITSLQSEYDSANLELATQKQLWIHIAAVMDIVRSNVSLANQFSESYILDRIRKAPLHFQNDIDRYIQISESHHEYHRISSLIDGLEKLNESEQSKQKLSTEVLDIEISKYRDELSKLRDQYNVKSSMLNRLFAENIVLSKLLSDIQLAKELMTDAEAAVKSAENKASVDYLTQLNSEVLSLRHSTRAELLELTRLIRDQETLIARLDKEVDSVINKLRPKHERAKRIEQALFELPIKYTQSFINSVIDDTNYFIDKLLTYPLVISKYNIIDECDFMLPVTIEHDVKSKDLSYCSDGQKAIINLAFNLALIIELKYNDYPLYVDEIDRALDTTHSHRLTKLLTSLSSTGVVSQMIAVNHHQSMIDGIGGDIIILNGDNITLPNTYNEYVTIVN